MAVSTLPTVMPRTPVRRFNTRSTVATLTPATRATSWIVTLAMADLIMRYGQFCNRPGPIHSNEATCKFTTDCHNRRMARQAKLAADIGGTFTDIVLEDGARRWSGKVLTTTHAPELGVIEGIEQVLLASGLKPQEISVFIHGTTLATNALIERKGAKTAFITTDGFRDIIEQGYEKRFDHYDLMIDRPVPLVPRTLRLEVRER